MSDFWVLMKVCTNTVIVRHVFTANLVMVWCGSLLVHEIPGVKGQSHIRHLL